MTTTTQLTLSLIPHHVNGTLINQRASDGYVNATAMCQAAGKMFSDYRRLKSTDEFLNELASVMGIPTTELIVSVQGGIPGLQGTWVHPDIAINLGQWLSAKFAVAVAKWVREWLSGRTTKPGPERLPYHVARYVANMDGIPHTHFSILNEMMVGLIGPLESHGYTLPDRLVPDISEGKMFSKFLRERGVDTARMPTYEHKYEDGRVVQARLYPNSCLALFRQHFHEVWLPLRAVAYFEERDAAAVPFLHKMLPSIVFKQMVEE